MADWPRWVDVTKAAAKPYEGWPITIRQLDNGMPHSGWTLDRIEAAGMTDPVLQLSGQSNGEIVYTLRIQGNAFTPPVFHDGIYTLQVMDPDCGVEKAYRNLRPRKN